MKYPVLYKNNTEKRCHEDATRKHIYSGTIFLRGEICQDEK